MISIFNSILFLMHIICIYLLTFNFWGVKKCRLDLDSNPKSSSLWCQNIIFWVRQGGVAWRKTLNDSWVTIKRKKEVIVQETKITRVLYSFILPESPFQNGGYEILSDLGERKLLQHGTHISDWLHSTRSWR